MRLLHISFQRRACQSYFKEKGITCLTVVIGMFVPFLIQATLSAVNQKGGYEKDLSIAIIFSIFCFFI